MHRSKNDLYSITSSASRNDNPGTQPFLGRANGLNVSFQGKADIRPRRARSAVSGKRSHRRFGRDRAETPASSNGPSKSHRPVRLPATLRGI